MKLLSRLLFSLALLWSPARADLLTTGVGSFGAPTCGEATTFLARTSGLDAAHTTAYRSLICGLVANGLWSGFDFLYVFSTQDATTANLNLVSTSFTLTPVNSWTFTADQGYTGNGSNMYGNTGFIPSTNAVQFTRTAGSMGLWSLTDKTAADTYEMAWREAGAGTGRIITKNVSSQFLVRINTGGVALTVANSDGRGFYVGNRSSETNEQGYRNGVQVSSTTGNSTAALSGATVFLDAGSVTTTTPEGFSVTQLSMAFIGRSFSALEQAQLYQIACGWQKAVGAATC